jgi:hypothetical protein
LQFFGGDPFFGGGHKSHCQVPFSQGKIRTLHNCAASDGGSEITLSTMPLRFGFEPIMFLPCTFFANYPVLLTVQSKMIDTTLLVGKVLDDM